MSSVDTKALRDLLSRATAGPWERRGPERFNHGQSIWSGEMRLFGNQHECTEDDFDLIVALRNNAEGLLDELEMMARAARDVNRAHGELCRAGGEYFDMTGAEHSDDCPGEDDYEYCECACLKFGLAQKSLGDAVCALNDRTRAYLAGLDDEETER